MASDTGLQRTNNEDAVAINTPLRLIVLADGMGGYNAGEIASGIAVREVQAALAAAGADQPPRARLDAAVRRAHQQIFDRARAEPDCQGMGTTLVATLLDEAQLWIAHVGDSRLYRLRDNQLTCLTRDHSLVEEMIARGQYSRDDAIKLVKKNIVTRALGVETEVEIDIQVTNVAEGDVYLACSDGLNDMIDDDMIAMRLRQGARGPLELLAGSLIQAALDAGGNDNVTVALSRVNALGDSDAPWYRRLIDHF